MPRSLFKFLLGILFFLGISHLTSSCLQFRMSSSEAEIFFKEQTFQPVIKSYKIDDRTINYAQVGRDSLPTVIFLHGSPGGWGAFAGFMRNEQLLQQVYMVSVDRPGYGYSNYGDPIPDLQNQCQLLKPILEETKHTPNILVGHSLGGPIAARLAMDYPDLVQGIILVAPSIDPALERGEWYRYLARGPLAKMLLPGSFWSTNEEIFSLREELEKMLPLWSKISVPVIVIQGEEDMLVPKENAYFAQRMVNPNLLRLQLEPDVNHFIPWNQPHLINQAIFDLVKDQPQAISGY